MSDKALFEMLTALAVTVRERAYAPYSSYKVGAAIATASGKFYVGCNVENASYGGTVCAERGAIMQMIAAGEREPIALVVATEGEEPASPCGFCRQVLSEFAVDMPIVLVGVSNKELRARRKTTLAKLLPMAFRKDTLQTAQKRVKKALTKTESAAVEAKKPAAKKSAAKPKK